MLEAVLTSLVITAVVVAALWFVGVFSYVINLD